MTVMIAAVLERLSAGENLAQDEMSDVIDLVVRGDVPNDQLAPLLRALSIKGETVEEIAGAAIALRRHMRPIRSQRSGLLDTCGTGGDASRTFNISTAAALVTAAAGVPVAKHGNRAASSRSGSADALAALGVNVNADLPLVERCLDTLGICFCFAPLFHPAMMRVADVRKRLGVPTIFNLLGPLTNPAGASFQLLGVGKPHLRKTLAEVLARLGIERGVVVCGEDHLDEVTIAGRTRVTVAAEGKLREITWRPKDFGLPQSRLDDLTVDDPAASAAMIRCVLAGDKGPARDIVLANTAAALWTARKSDSLETCAQLAAAAIDGGAARELLNRLVEMTNG
ncbi:MAG TPA: anthranilate phosphoribosyltransferase [Pirellulales bacterium]|jgi:anthranilate phosphoribosyltransferase|nr:anthranilate phosphoribosyltransferase [Pirellulales bacterium]